MIKLFTGIASLLLMYMADAQRLQIDNKTLSGSEVTEDTWYFQDEEDTIIAVSFHIYNELVKKARAQEAETQRLKEILQAKEALIASFESYESAADEHIEVQKALVSTADSLYTGYKGLYQDLKKLYPNHTLSLIPGLGYYDLPEKNGVMLSLGLDYKKVQGQFQFAEDYKGVVIGYRIPLF